MRVTSPPSARPWVCFMTKPMTAPIAFMLPDFMSSTALVSMVRLPDTDRSLRERGVDDPGELVGVAHRSEALDLDDRVGLSPGFDQVVEHRLCAGVGHGLLGNQFDQSGQRCRGDLRRGGIAVGTDASVEFTGHPVADALAVWRLAGGLDDGLKVGAVLGVEGEKTRRLDGNSLGLVTRGLGQGKFR